MSHPSVDWIIQAYLDRVAEELSDLPADDREEIRGDLEAHIREALGDPANASEAEVRNTLERLGDPVYLAREARGRVQTTTPAASESYEQRFDRSPSALEVASIILTAIVWPIGVLLAWVSTRWLARDKVIATLIPAAGSAVLLAVVVGGMVVWESGSTTTDITEEQAVPAEPGDTEVDPRSPATISESGSDSGEAVRFAIVIGFLLGAIASPFVAATYLAIRLQPVAVRVYPDGTQMRGEFPVGGQA